MTGTLIATMLLLGSATAGDEVIQRGAPLGDSPVVALADAFDAKDELAGKVVTVEGVVGDVCRMKGCWMGISSDGAPSPVRVTFKDYGFFVPLDAKGLNARMEGTFRVGVLSKDEADHLESEGATFERNPDGTVTELSFVASGVELRKPGSSD